MIRLRLAPRYQLLESRMNIAVRFVTPGILFLLTVVGGFWLSRAGKPYDGLIFNVHKLIALAAVIVAVIQTVNALKIVAGQPLFLALLAVIGLCAVALFVTGALMSANTAVYAGLLTIHRVAPLLVVVVASLALYLLGGRR